MGCWLGPALAHSWHSCLEQHWSEQSCITACHVKCEAMKRRFACLRLPGCQIDPATGVLQAMVFFSEKRFAQPNCLYALGGGEVIDGSFPEPRILSASCRTEYRQYFVRKHSHHACKQACMHKTDLLKTMFASGWTVSEGRSDSHQRSWNVLWRHKRCKSVPNHCLWYWWNCVVQLTSKLIRFLPDSGHSVLKACAHATSSESLQLDECCWCLTTASLLVPMQCRSTACLSCAKKCKISLSSTFWSVIVRWFSMWTDQLTQRQSLGDYMYLARPLSSTSMRFYVCVCGAWPQRHSSMARKVHAYQRLQMQLQELTVCTVRQQSQAVSTDKAICVASWRGIPISPAIS